MAEIRLRLAPRRIVSVDVSTADCPQMDCFYAARSTETCQQGTGGARVIRWLSILQVGHVLAYEVVGCLAVVSVMRLLAEVVDTMGRR